MEGPRFGGVVEKGNVSVRVLAGNEPTLKGSGEGCGMARYTAVWGSDACRG